MVPSRDGHCRVWGPFVIPGPLQIVNIHSITTRIGRYNGEWAVGGIPRAAVIRADRCHRFSLNGRLFSGVCSCLFFGMLCVL